jgi:hypothetical protein
VSSVDSCIFRKNLVRVVALAAVLAVVPTAAHADGPWPDQDTVRAVIIDRAAAHGVDPAALLCTDWKESRFQPSARGGMGERGVAQWLPGRHNAWDETSAYRVLGIDIVAEYERGNPDALWFDIDGQAEIFSRGEAARRQHWAGTYCRAP